MTRPAAMRMALPGVAVAAYVAMFAGRFSLARVLPAGDLTAAPWLELRLWALLAGWTLVLLAARQPPAGTALITRHRLWRGVGLVAALQLAFALHALWLRPQPGALQWVWELASTVAGVALVAAAYCQWGAPMLQAFLRVGVVGACALTALAWTARVMAPGVGDGFALGTVFTQVRIQCFGGMACLALMWGQGRSVRRSVALLVVAALCFTGAYLSLSKAILLAGLCALLFLAATHAVWFDRRKAAQVLAVAALSVAAFVALSGSMFASRVAEGLLGTGYSLSFLKVAPPRADEVPAPSGDTQARISMAQLQFDAQTRIAELLACSAGHYICAIEPTRWELEIVQTMLRHRVYLPDFSFRIRLLLEGMRGASSAPWLGQGFGSYRAVAINLYTGAPETYFYPHNIVVELLQAVGVVGLALVLAVAFGLAWLVLTARSAVVSALPMLAFALAIGLGAMFGGDYQDFRLFWWAMLLAVMACGPESESATGRREGVA